MKQLPTRTKNALINVLSDSNRKETYPQIAERLKVSLSTVVRYAKEVTQEPQKKTVSTIRIKDADPELGSLLDKLVAQADKYRKQLAAIDKCIELLKSGS